MLRKRSLFSMRWVRCWIASTEQVWKQKTRYGGGIYVWVPLIVLVTGQCTPGFLGFFSFEYRSPWCYNFFSFFFFIFRNLKEAFLWIKWPSPRLTSQGWWVYNGIFGYSSGGQCVPRKGCQWPEEMWFGFAGVPVCCGLSDSHPSTRVLLHTPWLQGLRHKPLSSRESVSTTWEG